MSHTVGVDSVEACGNIGGPANRAKLVVTISSCVSEVNKVGGGGDLSRSKM